MGIQVKTMEPLLLTPSEAAKALSICERTLYALTKSGELPVIRIGRAVRYSPDDIKAWIERSKKISENS
jgi:excisionase family DNA binding protein